MIGFLQEDFLLASNKRLFIGIWQKSKRMNGEKKKREVIMKLTQTHHART